MPFSSMCVMKISVYSEFTLELKIIHFPFGEKLCHELKDVRLQFIFFETPPFAGIINNSLSGWSIIPVLLCVNTIYLPSGEYLGK